MLMEDSAKQQVGALSGHKAPADEGTTLWVKTQGRSAGDRRGIGAAPTQKRLVKTLTPNASPPAIFILNACNVLDPCGINQRTYN